VAALATQYGEQNLSPGMCGWTQGISYYGDDQNTEFDAMQVTLAKQYEHGLAATVNYQWANAFDENSGFYTWSHAVTHQRDSNVRAQQFVFYGSYDLPFGKGKQFAAGANRAEDLAIGGYQIAFTGNWSGGLPFTVGFDQFNPYTGAGNAPAGWNVEDCNHNTGASSAPCRPNTTGHMHTGLTGFSASSKTRNFFNAQPRSGGLFSFPGLDVIGNAGANTYRGPTFFSSDLAITKAFTIWEHVETKFRMDAFNAFNHINAGNPGNTDVFGSVQTPTGSPVGAINGEAPGCVGVGGTCGPRQLEFSLRVQF